MDDISQVIDTALNGGVAAFAISQGQSVNGVTTSPAQSVSTSLVTLLALGLVAVLAFFVISKG